MFARVYLFAIITALGSIGTMNVLAQTCQTTYTVQVGNTCLTIAQKFDVTIPALLAANPFINADCTNLLSGEALCIPRTVICVAEYVVQPGDNCLSIANAFGITVDQLLVANPQINSGCTNLMVGEVLCIP